MILAFSLSFLSCFAKITKVSLLLFHFVTSATLICFLSFCMQIVISCSYKDLVQYLLISYRKIPIINHGFILFNRLFYRAFFWELIFGGAYYWREFCISIWVGLDSKNSLNTKTQA